MSDVVFGECAKHPGNNMVNCSICKMDKISGEQATVLHPSPIQSQINADAATIKQLQEDNERLTLQVNIAQGSNRELVDVLKKSVKIIEQWHGKEVFDIYYNHAPEMKPVREALNNSQ